jgi:hypothetical protein
MASPGSFKAQVDARIKELRPLHEEYLALVELKDKLGRTSGTATSTGNGRRRSRRGRPAARTTSTRSTTTRRRRGRPPKGGKTRADETLALIKANPGITVGDIAKRMKIRQNYLYRVTGQLQKAGSIRRRGGGFHAA